MYTCPMTVGLYARVSTKDKGQETENQLLQLRVYCKKQEWSIIKEYIDHMSAKTGDRPEFTAMLADASRHEFDLVLFWSLDRFSREGVMPTLRYLEMLTSYGVGWKSYTEQYLDSCGIFKDAVLSILATIAKQERIRLSERILSGMDRSRKQGTKFGRKPLVIDRYKIDELRSKNTSIRNIAREMGVSPTYVTKYLTKKKQEAKYAETTQEN